MEKTKEKYNQLMELKEKLMTVAKQELERGAQNVDTHEMGEVVDMIKDLSEAEEKCWKACYYKTIVEAMKKSEEAEELALKLEMSGMGDSEGMGRMGYDSWRYSSGRFAPSGHGHRSGYMPQQMEEDRYIDPWMMGYSGGGRGGSSNSGNSGRSSSSGSSGGSQNGSSSGSSGGSYGYDGRMGYSGSERGHRYDRYNQARMGYHESRDAASKEHMDASSREYVVDVAEAVKEIWKDADPAMRKEIKNKFTALMGEMN